MKYLETVIESGILNGIGKTGYIHAFESLDVFGKKFKKDSIIFNEGDIVDKICIVEKGCVRGEKMYVQGEAHIMQLYEEHMIFGLEAAVSKFKTSAMDYVCHKDTEVVFIPMHNVLSSRYSEAIMQILLQKLADDNIKRINKINILAHKGLREKILIYLNVLQKKARGNGQVVHVNMNREQMAQYLCVNRSALSNELNKMKREGLIDFKKNEFIIYNKNDNEMV